jgi:hypothetical protein
MATKPRTAPAPTTFRDPHRCDTPACLFMTVSPFGNRWTKVGAYIEPSRRAGSTSERPRNGLRAQFEPPATRGKAFDLRRRAVVVRNNTAE